MAKIEVATFEQLATILTQLATNYSNIFDDYYNMFYNEEEKEIVLQLYNSEGKIDTIRVPNRAMDRKYIKNGEGSPDGVLSAVRGTIYQDLTNGDLYLKQSGDGGPFGWYKLLSESKLEDILIQGYGSPVNTVDAALGTLYVDKASGVVYVKTSELGTGGWKPITASASLFAYNDLTNLTAAGESHFANPSLSNLNAIGRSWINGKQDQEFKVTSEEGITDACTDEQYPSARATYEYVNALKTISANKDLNNLNQEGEEHFLGKPQIKGGLIYAPNGLPYANLNSSTISIPFGTVVLGANGIDATLGTNINTRRTVPQPSPSVTVSWTSAKDGVAFYNLSENTIVYYELSSYSESSKAPTGKKDMLWYNPDNNTYSVTSNSGSNWNKVVLCEIARFQTNTSGKISNFYAYHPTSVATKDDLYNKVNTDLSNIKNLTQIRAVVDTGMLSNGTFYRLYDDTFIEQSWVQTIATGGTVTLPYPMASSSYFINGVLTGNNSGVLYSLYLPSQTSCKIYINKSGSFSMRFYACGYRG